MPDLRVYLLGEWSVERTMLDRATGTRGTFNGTAVFAPAAASPAHDGALLHREHGTVRWGSHEGPATREYLWRPAEPAGAPRSTMGVFFPDGRPFHTVDLSGASADADHWCSPDDYRVHYEAMGPDELRYTWDVRGPAKDLLLTSVLRRLPSPPR